MQMAVPKGGDIRDFLTGRDEAVRRYSAPFLEIDDKDRVGLTRLCATLNEEYHQQCKSYKWRVKNDIDVSTTSSLTLFTKAVVHFADSLDGTMSLAQAKTIISSARFLRMCVAGRAVYSQKCVNTRDRGHIEAENLFGRALVALNNKRAEAIAKIAVSSNPQKKKKTNKKTSGKKGKGAKGAKGARGASASDNFYGVLSDELTVLEQSLDEVKISGEDESKQEEEEKAGEDVSPFPMEQEQQLDTAAVLQEFLDNEVRDNQDTVHYVLQADHNFSIQDSIWGPSGDKESVYLDIFNNIPLPTKHLHAIIHAFPNNRLVLFDIAHQQRYLQKKMTVLGSPENTQLLVGSVAEFVATLNKEELCLIYACRLLFFLPGEQKQWERRLKLLKIVLHIDPLCISYLVHYADMYFTLLCTTKYSSRTDEVQTVASFARSFTKVIGNSLENILVDEIEIDHHAAIANASNMTTGHTDRVSITYEPTYVSFVDRRLSQVIHDKYINLPVEVLEDDSYVAIKIHDNDVDEYVKSIIAYNASESEKCRVFIPSSHVVHIENDPALTTQHVREVHFKHLGKVIHVDGTETSLL